MTKHCASVSAGMPSATQITLAWRTARASSSISHSSGTNTSGCEICVQTLPGRRCRAGRWQNRGLPSPSAHCEAMMIVPPGLTTGKRAHHALHGLIKRRVEGIARAGRHDDVGGLARSRSDVLRGKFHPCPPRLLQVTRKHACHAVGLIQRHVYDHVGRQSFGNRQRLGMNRVAIHHAHRGKGRFKKAGAVPPLHRFHAPRYPALSVCARPNNPP